jgi:hypothetical protein
MGISYIPGPEQLLAPAVDQIAKGVMKFLNPNRDLQFAVRGAMATNPELLQHMADIEGNNPGTMAKLGLGPIADIIGSVSQSAGALTEKALRPGAAGTATAQQGAARSTAEMTTQKNQLNSDIIKKAGTIMGADPSISFDAALRTLTGQTGTERTAEETKAKVEQGVASKQLEQLQRAGQLPKDLSQVNWRSKANDFLNGKLPGSEAVAYFGNTDTSKAFQEAIDGIKQDRQIAASTALAALHGDKTVDNFRTQKAFQEYERSGGVGSLATWQKFLFDPATQARAKQLVTGTIKPSGQDDQDLMQIAQVTKTQVDTDKLKDIATLNNSLAKQMKAATDAPSDDARQVAIDGLNQLFKMRGSMGGIEVTATYNDRGFFLPGRIEYKDKRGKIVDEATVNAIVADPLGSDITARGPNLNDRARNALSLITNFQGDKQAALNKFKMQDQSANKQDSQAVEAEMRRQGLIK